MGKIIKGAVLPVLLAAVLILLFVAFPVLAVNEPIKGVAASSEPMGSEEESTVPSEESSSQGSGDASTPSYSNTEPEDSNAPGTEKPASVPGKGGASRNKQNASTVPQENQAIITFQWTEEMNKALQNAISWLKTEEAGDFYLISLGIVGGGTKTSTTEMYFREIQEKAGIYTSGKELAVDILGITFSGASASSFRDINFINALGSYNNKDMQVTEVLSWLLIAMDSNDYTAPEKNTDIREKLVESLLKNQNDDGGFGEKPGAESDMEETAMAITALSAYTNQSSVKSNINEALSFLSGRLQQDGFYAENPIRSSETASKIIIGLSALQMDLNDKRFCLNEKNMVEILLDYSSSEGGFAKQPEGTLQVEATEMAVIALYAAENSLNPFQTQNAIDTSSYNSIGEMGAVSEDKGLLTPIIAGILVLAAVGLAAVLRFRFIKNNKKSAGEETEPEDTKNGPEEKKAAGTVKCLTDDNPARDIMQEI